MIRIFVDGKLCYDSRLDDYELLGLKVTRGLNKGGTAEIVMPPYHPAYAAFTGFKSIVEIWRDDRLKFRGRALYPVDDFLNQRTVVCEGELCFLQDIIRRAYSYQDKPGEIFRRLIEYYNIRADDFKKFEIGTIDVEDPDDSVQLESETAESVLAVLNKLLERCGGYITFTTSETGARVINWTKEVGRISSQIIENGDNLFDFTSTEANTDLATALIPYGAKIETEGGEGEDDDGTATRRVTIRSVNGSLDYIVDADAVTKHGTIYKTVVWDDVTSPSILKRRAEKYLNSCKNTVTSLTLTALDASYVSAVESFDVGDSIRVRSRAHKLNDFFPLTEIEEDLLNPGSNRITLGKDVKTLTGLDVAGDDKSSSDLQQIATAIKQDFAANITQDSELFTTLIEQTFNRITLSASGSLGGKAQITMTVDGSDPKAVELDLSEVRKAFANDNTSTTISAGTITFNSNTLIVNSTNLRVSSDGTIQATNAELSGTATTESGLYKSELSAGRLRFYYDGTEYGGIASDYIAGSTATRGVTVRLSEKASYMGFSRLNEETEMYNLWYCINFGANINDRTERHLFFGTSYFSEQATMDAGLYVSGNATFVSATFFYQTATYYGAAMHYGNAFFANGKGVALYKTDGETVFSMTMTSDDLLYFGSTSAPTYVVGSSVQLGYAGYPTTIAGSSVLINNSVTIQGAVTIRNNSGLMIKDSGGTARYVLSMTSANQVSVGSSSHPLYLTATGVTIPSGGLSLGAGSVIMANGYGVVVCDSAGATHYVISLTSGNMVNVGTASYVTYLRGTAVYLASSGAAVTSDERKKNSIEEIPDTYEAVLDKLTPVRYKYNDGTSGRYHTGFIAQEVQAALESAGLTAQDFGGFVDLNGDGETLGLIYTEFIALLLQKIKRQEARIAALEAVQ